ncbi:hypothetical protein [Endozoicomonas sp. 2B-B]
MPEAITISFPALLGLIVLLINLVVIGPVGWILRQHILDHRELKKTIYVKLDELEEKHNNLRQELPDKYVSIKRYLKEMDEFRQLLHRILEKLDNKADK